MTPEQSQSGPEQGPDSVALLRTVLLCDLTDSTALVERLGDQAAAKLIRRHDVVARAAMHRHAGREMGKTDGFLVLFDRPIDAVAFALEYQRDLRMLAQETGQSLSARVGIHVGDVIVWDNAPVDVAHGAKTVEVEGLAKPVAARLMAMAYPGQILLTGVAYALARRAESELSALPGAVRWVSHGRFQLKGVPESIEVHEVGEVGVAPLRPPLGSPKARRATPWRRRGVMAAVVFVLLAAAVSAYLSLRDTSALAFAERDWVVIGDVANVNAETEFADTVAAAFRVGIEQSRFVNVVTDVQMREALARMQRDERTRIDRTVGSEIALREQARALVLPSLVRYETRLRVSVELVDPQSTRTVATQIADADNPNDLLSAIDRLVVALRRDLGESLNQIQSTSQALEKVTTPHLAALRVYSHAQQIMPQGDVDQELNLLTYATELDPDFAMAHARIGLILYSQQRYPEARAALNRALSISGRLTERERLYIRAQLARFDEPKVMLNLWRTYGELYPDSGIGQNNLGNFRYMLMHDYAGAETALRAAVATRNPARNLTLHALAYVLLAQEKLDEAERQFQASEAASPAALMFGLSDALAARGKLDDAARYLDAARRQPPGDEIERAMRRATLLITRGELDTALNTIHVALPDMTRLPGPNARWRATAAAIAVRAAQGDMATARTEAERHFGDLMSIALQPSWSSLEVMEHLLYVAWWSARLGMYQPARQALALARQRDALAQFPVRAALAELVAAELELGAGRAERVAEQLRRASNGQELWELHEIRARALRMQNDVAGELAELRWLTGHRGLAYAQWIDQLLGQQARAIALRDADLRLQRMAGAPTAR